MSRHAHGQPKDDAVHCNDSCDRGGKCPNKTIGGGEPAVFGGTVTTKAEQFGGDKGGEDNEERESVADEVVRKQPKLLVTENISEKTVDMTTLDQHPAKRGEKKIMESERHSRAEERWLSGIKSSQEEEVGEEKGKAEVAMYGGPVALQAGHQ